jgi:hypothetical protein
MRSHVRIAAAFALASIAATALGQTRYTIGDPCLPASCAGAISMNDAGALIGYGFIFDPGTGFRLISPAGLIPTPQDINSLGDVTGWATLPRASDIGPPIAIPFLYRRGDSSWEDLNSSFTYPASYPGSYSIPALSINDLRQVAASSDFDHPPGLPNQQIVKINNAGQIIGNSFSNPPGVLYTPGQGTIALPGTALWLNNRGQVLERISGSSYDLFTPGQGSIPLPRGFFPTQVNDAGDIAGYINVQQIHHAAVFRSSTKELIDLNDAIGPNPAWFLFLAPAINNRGQIAAIAGNTPPAFRNTTLILTPQ